MWYISALDFAKERFLRKSYPGFKLRSVQKRKEIFHPFLFKRSPLNMQKYSGEGKSELMANLRFPNLFEKVLLNFQVAECLGTEKIFLSKVE